ncbi:hypothetical protein FSP39_008907 [Pinctada imbricata]|uniref:MULE transposase domain-containing protein n=1 Tax=Pinctada imbricata TaxID=66713 RepID=A0AA88YI38_PINIB|nr:hypothetical protein FSP39_008907 [Pinctada imbricata]
MVDFERALWQSLRDVFPSVPIQGCVFHFIQAVWRRTQELGLSPAYRDDDDTHSFTRQLMALPFLPATHIQPAFDQLKTRTDTTPLNALVDYIDRQWITNPIFPPSSWSVHRMTVRTNNDVEDNIRTFCWHTRLNQKTGGFPGVYRLINILHRESQLVETSIAAGDFTREKNSRYTRLNARLNDAWSRYDAGDMQTGSFLRHVGHLYCAF